MFAAECDTSSTEREFRKKTKVVIKKQYTTIVYISEIINMSIKVLILLFLKLIISDTFSFTLQRGVSPRYKLKLYSSKPPWGSFFDNLFQTTTQTKPPKVDLSIYDNDINSAKVILLEAALTKKVS